MDRPGMQQTAFPRPGRVLKVVLGGLFAIWLVFALGMNWGGVSEQPFLALTSSTPDIIQGEFWRLLTAPLLHHTQGISHILLTMFMLYMFGSSLEQSWGPKRFAKFLFLTGVLSYFAQFLVALVLPAALAPKLVSPFSFGASPVVEALVIAWACTFRGRTVYLFFALPVTSKQLIYLAVGINVLMLIAWPEPPPSGFIALFSGMALGWLLGGDTPSPLRKYYLKYRLAELEREAKDEAQAKRKRVARSGLKVIPGGKDDGPPPKDMLN